MNSNGSSSDSRLRVHCFSRQGREAATVGGVAQAFARPHGVAAGERSRVDGAQLMTFLRARFMPPAHAAWVNLGRLAANFEVTQLEARPARVRLDTPIKTSV